MARLLRDPARAMLRDLLGIDEIARAADGTLVIPGAERILCRFRPVARRARVLHRGFRLGELLEVIDEREATILRLRYGLGVEGAEPMTLKEIGKVVGLTRERVRQIEQEALRKLYGVMGGEE